MTTTDSAAAAASYAAYLASLPRVLAGAAALFRDDAGRVLLVEPNYREGWALPGGTIESDEGETPRTAARRETAEEIGLDVPIGRLLVVDWSRDPGRPPFVSYVYDGGVLDEAQLAAIELQEAELISWKLVEPAELGAYLPAWLRSRIEEACRVLETGAGTTELEDGRPALA
ncbi:NUDIX domain-containing protein [Streptomyces sp. NPDC048603]|uniref:NUDIX domain-containing protein n=1 Tax=Streptomyces sp. NPDC048603 TaxID=3365577 RepID=UPI003722B098